MIQNIKYEIYYIQRHTLTYFTQQNIHIQRQYYTLQYTYTLPYINLTLYTSSETDKYILRFHFQFYVVIKRRIILSSLYPVNLVN